MTPSFMPEGSAFNGKPNILPPPYLAELAIGHVIADEQHAPLVYSRKG